MNPTWKSNLTAFLKILHKSPINWHWSDSKCDNEDQQPNSESAAAIQDTPLPKPTFGINMYTKIEDPTGLEGFSVYEINRFTDQMMDDCLGALLVKPEDEDARRS